MHKPHALLPPLPCSPPVSRCDPRRVAPQDDDREDPAFVANLYALYDAGITEPTAGRLAGLPHVTPAYVHAHVDIANAEGYGLGMAVYRIEHAWPIPAPQNRKLTVDERLRRFLQGRRRPGIRRE